MSRHLATLIPSAFLLTLVGTFCVTDLAAAATISGRVQLGAGDEVDPLADVPVTLLEATEGTPVVMGQAVTDRLGRFQIESARQNSSSIFFLTADIERGVQFVTILGVRLPAQATINELTSVAASYSMAQFYRNGYISGNAFGLRIGALMSNNIVAPASGESSDVLLISPNADQTHSLRMTRSLANMLNAAARDIFARYLFLLATSPEGSWGDLPENTAVGMANLARNPGWLVYPLYRLSQTSTAYGRVLQRLPAAWTVTVKVNDSGNDNYLFGGPANVAFDSRGFAWVANNTIQGTPFSAKRIMVLRPDGKPSVGRFGRAASPVTGGGILGDGWGITVDRTDTVWIGNFGWGGDDYFPTLNPIVSTNPLKLGNGSVSSFSVAGTALSAPIGYFGGTLRVQAIKVDQDGNVWCCSFGNDKVIVFPGGDPRRSQELQFYEGAGPFGLAVAPNGDVWVSNSGGLAGLNRSSVARVRLDDDGKLQLLFLTDVGNTLKVIDVDSRGNAWVASQGDDTVYGFRPNGHRIGGFTGGGVRGPWGLCIDGEDNLWVANFGKLIVDDNFTRGRISKLCGINRDAWPPKKSLGDPITPITGFTVQSAGSQVLLHDGTPLYGTGMGAEPSYAPIMRQTSVQIDQAGNIWSVNNWKPRFTTDIGLFNDGTLVVDMEDANPGGDGLIIFVGLAPPPPSQFGM